MSKSFKRTDRVAGEIQRKLSQIIRMEVKDPRLSSFVTITGVDVSGDLSYAKVYFTDLKDDPKKTAAILNSAASFIRTALARTMKLRIVPELRFIYDESIEYGRKLSELINKVAPDNDDEDQSE